jgi:hypothetical protein
MPRTVTLTFEDGRKHVYNGVPDTATPDQVMARASQEFQGAKVVNIDGGKKAQATVPNYGEAANRPEANVLGMKVNGEADSGFNPAAAIIGAGEKLTKLNAGVDDAKLFAQYALQRLIPGTSRGIETLDRLEESRQAGAESDKEMAKLRSVHPYSVMAGETVPYLAAPVKTLPLVAAAEQGTPTERLMRAGVAYAGNKGTEIAGKAVGNKIAEMGQQRAANAVRDANVGAAKQAGYAAIPSEVGGNLPGRVLEGASGKIKTGQLTSVKNQPVTDRLVRKEFNLPEDAPLTLETMKAVRAREFESGYAPVREFGGGKVRIKLDGEYGAKIDSLTSRADNASKAFGDVVKSDIDSLVGGMKQAKPFTPAEGLDASAILREKASDMFASGKRSDAKAYIQASEAIEGQIERFLTKSGKDGAKMLVDFRSARQTMAKTFDVEKAINTGRDGMINAQTLGKILKKSPGRLSGDLRTIAAAANSMPQATRIPQQGWNSPITAVDTWGGTIGSAASGNLLPFLAPAARVAARYGVLSKPGQKAFTNPNYDPSLLLRGEKALLDNQYAPQIGGLLGLAYANR